MNLTDYRITPVHRAFEAVRHEAKKNGTDVEESEVVGLIPEDALFDAGEFFLELKGFHRSAILERKVREVDARSGGESIASFTTRLAARTPTPGGGSAAAVTGSIAAALGEMVLAYSIDATHPDAELTGLHQKLEAARTGFLEMAEADSRSYDLVRLARRARKAAPGEAAAEQGYLAALQGAAETPLATARLASELSGLLRSVRGRTKATLESDLVTSLALLHAAMAGALANVEINLVDLKAVGASTEELEREVAGLRALP
jgi:glutamate formiminotransferase / formiminotetrahydrofolate cyclodeaminase